MVVVIRRGAVFLPLNMALSLCSPLFKRDLIYHKGQNVHVNKKFKLRKLYATRHIYMERSGKKTRTVREGCLLITGSSPLPDTQLTSSIQQTFHGDYGLHETKTSIPFQGCWPVERSSHFKSKKKRKRKRNEHSSSFPCFCLLTPYLRYTLDNHR